MASTSETGHAKNVANFQDLIEFVTGYGGTYNPSKTTLKLGDLISLKASAEGNLTDVISKNTAYNNKVNERIIAFSDLKSLSTRLVNALQTTDATPETINNAKTFNRKLQGKKSVCNTNTNGPKRTSTINNIHKPTILRPINPTSSRFNRSFTSRAKLCTKRTRINNCNTTSKTNRPNH